MLPGDGRSAAGLLTVREVARLFGVSSATVRRWHQQGRLQGYRSSPRGPIRFRREDVAIAYLDRALRRYFHRQPR